MVKVNKLAAPTCLYASDGSQRLAIYRSDFDRCGLLTNFADLETCEGLPEREIGECTE